jgi:hypothetical protein
LRGRSAGTRGKPEAPGELFTLNVAERDRKGIRGVGRLGRFLHLQKGTHHQLHLFFVGMAIASDTGFYFARGIGVNFHTVLLGSQENNAAHFGQAQGGAHIQRGKDGLDGHGIRVKLFDEPAKKCVDILKASAGGGSLPFG